MANQQSKPDSVASLKKELANLRSENKKLKQQFKSSASKSGKGSAKRTFKRTTSVFLVILTALLINISVANIWVRRNLINTNVWVEKTTNYIEDPVIRAEISKKLATRAIEEINAEQYISEILPNQVELLARPLTSSLESFTAKQLDELMQTQKFKTFWMDANRSAHKGIVDSLKNQGVATQQVKNNDVVYIDGDSLFLNLKPIYSHIRTDLADRGLNLPNKLSAADVKSRVAIYQIKNLPTILTAFDFINRVTIIILVLTLLCLIGALLLAESARKLMIELGLATALLMIANVQALYLAQYSIVQSVSSSVAFLNTEAAQSAFDIITRDLVMMNRVLLGLSLLLVLVMILIGPSKLAVNIRKYTNKVFSVIYKHDGLNRWVATNTLAAKLLLLGLGIVLLLFPIFSGPYYLLGVIGLIAGLAIYVFRASR